MFFILVSFVRKTKLNLYTFLIMVSQEYKLGKAFLLGKVDNDGKDDHEDDLLVDVAALLERTCHCCQSFPCDGN